jgi:hypothetical protein
MIKHLIARIENFQTNTVFVTHMLAIRKCLKKRVNFMPMACKFVSDTFAKQIEDREVPKQTQYIHLIF